MNYLAHFFILFFFLKKKKTLLCLQHNTDEVDLMRPGEYWEHTLWLDGNEFGSDGVQHVWREPGQDYHSECIVLMVKH